MLLLQVGLCVWHAAFSFWRICYIVTVNDHGYNASAGEDLWVVIYKFLFSAKVISYFIHNDGTSDAWKPMWVVLVGILPFASVSVTLNTPFLPGLLTSSNVWDWLIFLWTLHNFCRHLHNAGCSFHTLHSSPSPAVFGVKFHTWTLFVSAIIIPCVVNILKITFCLERWRTLGGPAAGAAAKLEDTPDMLANYYESCERRPFQIDCRSWVWFCWLLLQGCFWHGRGNHGCWQWHANPCWSRERNKWYAFHCKPEIILQDWIPPLMSLRTCTRVIHMGKMLNGA